MDITIIILIGAVLILLLLVVFLMLMVSRITATPEQQAKHKAHGHKCNECIFCKNKKCTYLLEDNINEERPACIYYEEKKVYKPA